MSYNNGLKARIQRGYDAIAKAQSQGKDTTEYEKQLLLLEKRYVEETLGVTLTKVEINELKTLCTVKAIFPGARLIGVSTRKKRYFKY